MRRKKKSDIHIVENHEEEAMLQLQMMAYTGKQHVYKEL